MNDGVKKIIEKVNCPYQVFGPGDLGCDVVDAYMEALERGKQQGFTPLLVVLDETLQEWFGILEDEAYSREDEIAKVTGKGREILERRYLEYTEGCTEEEMDEYEGEISGGESINSIGIFYDMFTKEVRETILFEIPVKNPWEVIGWFPMGGWNECPRAFEMMEICRYWHEKYQAVPAVLSHDELEFYVGRSIDDKGEAMELAREHFAFCIDRVEQGTAAKTIGEVASTLMKSKVWYFWWD